VKKRDIIRLIAMCLYGFVEAVVLVTLMISIYFFLCLIAR